MTCKLEARSAEFFLNPRNQEDLLEHRTALLARRHISDTRTGTDTSYDVFQLTMAHADLVYWRGLQSKAKDTPKGHESAVKAVVDLVSAMPAQIVEFIKRIKITNCQSLPSPQCWKVWTHLWEPLTSLSLTSRFFGRYIGATSRCSPLMSTPSSTHWDLRRWSSTVLSQRTIKRRMRRFWRRHNRVT
jgi:hypothetical protein